MTKMIKQGESLEYLLDHPVTPETLAWEHSLDISATVYKRMKALGIKSKDLAKSMGVSASFVSRLLSGEQNITLQTLAKLECALGIDMSSGFSQHNQTKNNNCNHQEYRNMNGLLQPEDIKKAREYYNMTENEFARVLKVTPEQIVSWENDEEVPPVHTDLLIQLFMLHSPVAKDLMERAEIRIKPVMSRRLSTPMSSVIASPQPEKVYFK